MARIQRCAIGIAGHLIGTRKELRLTSHPLACAIAGKQQPALSQSVGRMTVIIHMGRLEAHRTVKGNAEPFQILKNGLNMLAAAAQTVDILNSQQKLSTMPPRFLLVQQGGIGMTQMQKTIGTGGKTKDGLHHYATIMHHAPSQSKA